MSLHFILLNSVKLPDVNVFLGFRGETNTAIVIGLRVIKKKLRTILLNPFGRCHRFNIPFTHKVEYFNGQGYCTFDNIERHVLVMCVGFVSTMFIFCREDGI